MKVLVVVEDDEEMGLLIRRVLGRDERIESHGSAATAKEAIEVAKDYQPDLIILDHYIEGDVMGLQAAPLLKEVCPNTKILLFSSFNLGPEAKKEPAVDAFLPKKQLNDLLGICREMLGLNKAS